MGTHANGQWVGEQKSLGKTPMRGNPSPEMTYLPTSVNATRPHWSKGHVKPRGKQIKWYKELLNNIRCQSQAARFSALNG